MLKTSLGYGTLALIIVAAVGFQNCGAVTQPDSSLNLSSTSTGEVPCTGTFSLTVGSATGTLLIANEDTLGDINGNLLVTGVNGTITGTCTGNTTSGNINFTRNLGSQYQLFTGVLFQSTSGIGVTQMSGTVTTCTSGGGCGGPSTWSAVFN